MAQPVDNNTLAQYLTSALQNPAKQLTTDQASSILHALSLMGSGLSHSNTTGSASSSMNTGANSTDNLTQQNNTAPTDGRTNDELNKDARKEAELLDESISEVDETDEETLREKIELNEPGCSEERRERLIAKHARNNAKKRAVEAKTYGDKTAAGTGTGTIKKDGGLTKKTNTAS